MYAPQARVALPPQPGPQVDTDRYAEIAPNPVQRVAEQPVSTFSVDVDTGSYSNVRRMLVDGRLPPADAVRAEELINYFRYDYPLPASPEVPFSVSTEVAPAPWDPRRHLLRIGIRGYDIDRSALPPANLVLLIDTSGSMHSPAKLPLLKQAFGQFVGQLRAQDRVAIVAYAGSAGMVLAPTPGDQHGEILAALGRLEAGGSTNGGAGLELAYALARQGFVEGGINRVLLATDGDFNVGTVDQGALETMVARQRATGVALSTLGFGTGNYNDAMAERLADLGDGNHAYIDSALEARRVLVEQMGSTLMTIARDVKVQVEFNPAQVAEYRLIGYENRLLRREDFDNDRVDAGDIGAGHTVTALYEIALAGSGGERIAPLRYAAPAAAPAHGDELAWLRLRYKEPRADASRLVETPIRQADMRAVPGTDFRFAAAVAAYADLLRGGAHVGGFGWDETIALAQGARGDDAAGERAEFLRLARHAQALEPVAAAAGAD
ncbi:VWA domain-containing protein [Coralloluteibacterium stylophorae]|uniref:VWA domain-containing protein n=2 Tax=Coralloluteibacterium stylophorae TaxID=1776034 RepID=A0A8J7VVM4_9GAMM|nr:VWA domain-containing protein [Coralloluteibacterium stylophorae]